MDLNTLIKTHQQKIEALQEQMVNDFNAMIQDASNAFFEKYPQVLAIAWTQYTPYFNDGDACEFSVHEPHVLVRDSNEDGEDEVNVEEYSPYDGYSEWNIRDLSRNEQKRVSSGLEWMTPEFHKDFVDFTEFTKNEDLMERVFGDHATVYITKEGSTVCEYDHD